MDRLAQALAARQSGLTSGGIQPQGPGMLAQVMGALEYPQKDKDSLASIMANKKQAFSEGRMKDFITGGFDDFSRIVGPEAIGAGTIRRVGGTLADAMVPMSGTLGRQDVSALAKALMDKVEAAYTPNARTGNIEVPFTSRKVTNEYVDDLNSGLNVTDNGIYEPNKFVKPEDLKHDDASLLAMAWDRSHVGDLDRIAGKNLESPIRLDGGNAYPRGLGNGAGASGDGPINAAIGAVKRQEGTPLYSMFSAMGGEATDFSTMGVRAALAGFDPKTLPKGAAASFDKKFAALKGSPKDFPGVGSKDLESWLMKGGKNRYAFMKHLDKAEWVNQGFPDAAAARHAVTDPALLNLPNGVGSYGGHSISLMDPKGVKGNVSDLPNPHTTYPRDVPKDSYTGQFAAPTPQRVLLPKWYDERRAAGALPRSDGKSFEFQTVVQPIDNKWVDTNSMYQEEFMSELAKRKDDQGLLKGLLR